MNQRMVSRSTALSLVLMVAGAILTGCGARITDQDEIAQTAGDMMASVDESSGSSTGSYSFLSPRSTTRYASLSERALESLLPSAWAATCGSASEFSACSSGTIMRRFGGCTIGFATVSGTVGLTWSGNGDCTLDIGETVSRTPNFTVTGRRGGTLEVTATGSQQIERTGASAFLFRNSGINRKLTNASGETLFDLDFLTTADISIRGTRRSDRVMDGGTLTITNNTREYVVTLSPNLLTWTSTCNCAVSGSLRGSVSGSERSKAFVIEITGCGSATVTSDGSSEDVTFDRCVGV